MKEPTPGPAAPTDEPVLVQGTGELRRLCAELSATPWLALDTEFQREDTYYPRLCLMQVATRQGVYCVDPQASVDLTPLLDLLYEPDRVKVMHAARQDLEIFFHMRGKPPGPVFDTQVAAPLLGYQEQVGYGELVYRVLGVRLAKGHARSDWTRRPLPEAQLRYAADDVRYLVPMYERLLRDLRERGRLEWLEEDFARLVHPDSYATPPEEAWRKVKGVDRLRGSSLAVAQALAEWRERSAQELDRPRRWLLRDEAIVDIARLKPGNTEALKQLRSVPESVRHRHGATVLERVAGARNRKPREARRVDSPRLDPQQEATADALMALARLLAWREGLNPASLLGRRDLERIAAGEAPAVVLKGWRRGLFADSAEAFLQGRLRLEAREGRLAAVSSTGVIINGGG